ncbi:MAG: hypothetical protein P9L94_16885 [Candidatus Hinthialibacter antarcticus]|nr:hypothetical protein [Candidatus Hinthialibacter antarcticus]
MVEWPDGSIIVAENDSGEISRLRTNSLFSTLRIDTLMTGFTDPVALAFDSGGRLLVGERSTGRVIAVGNNQRETLFRGLNDLASIRTDQLDNIYYVEMDPGRISRYSLRSNGHTLIQDGLSFPSDSFVFGRSLMTSELVDRSGISGRVTMEPIAVDQDPIPLPPIFEWSIDDAFIDPIRFVQDPRNNSHALLSVRHVDRTIAGIQSPGAIYQINLITGKVEGLFVEDLYGPTDMVANENGCFVLEEHAERISFYDWSGKRNVLWDGLGAPIAFTVIPNQINRYLIAETAPHAGISSIVSQIVRPSTMPAELENESIGSILATTKLFLSITNLGEIVVVNDDGTYETLTSQLFAPGKLVKGEGNSIWAYDLIGELKKLNSDTGKVMQSARGAQVGMVDFDVEVDGSLETAYALDALGDIWQYATIRNVFTPVSILTLEFADDYNSPLTPVFARVADEGFVIAMNDLDGSIVWIDDNGGQEVIHTGFREITQLHAESRLNITALSNRGWLRTIRLMYPSDIPEPTPTPFITPTPVLPTRTPTPNRPGTPSPTPIRPTPTPTEVTSIIDWLLHVDH